jgi:hypothetical protein
MERVTFQNKNLVEKIKASCVCTWRNIVPGYETMALDDPEIGNQGPLLTTCMTKSPPGTASVNIATIFSTGDGKVLHIAPGLLSPEDLGKELDFALSVDRSVKEAGGDAVAREKAFTAAHDARKAQLEKATGLDSSWRKLITAVHKGLSSRPIVALQALKLSDYFEQTPDTDEVRLSGKKLKEEMVKQLKH